MLVANTNTAPQLIINMTTGNGKHISHTCAVFLVLVQSVSIPAHTRVVDDLVNANVFTLVTWISRVAFVDRCVKYVYAPFQLVCNTAVGTVLHNFSCTIYITRHNYVSVYK